MEDRDPRLVILLFSSQAFVRGILNVLIVVASVELLHAGDAGVGWLNAALGLGGLAGVVVGLGLLGRRKLGLPFGLALVTWGAPIGLVGAWPRMAWALACLGVVGVGLLVWWSRLEAAPATTEDESRRRRRALPFSTRSREHTGS